MPVTAKLSRRFYEQFGDDVTNELVDWMNSVDATYQTSLRELNEINFARFDAKLEQRIAAVETRLDQRIAAVESRLDERIAGVESRLGARMDGLEGQMEVGFAEQREGLVSRIAASESRMIRWMVTLWTGSILATVGLMVAILGSK